MILRIRMFIVGISLLVGIIFSPTLTADATWHTVSICIDRPTNEVMTPFNTSCNMTFTGSVEYSMREWVSWDHRVIQLCVDAGAWNATITPMTIDADDSGSSPFLVHVTVPPGTYGGSCHEITVYGNCTEYTSWMNETTVETGSISPSKAVIVCTQSYNASIGFGIAGKCLEAGSNQVLTVEVGIANTGNGNETYCVAVTNAAQLADKGLTVRLPGPVTLGPLERASVSISLSASGAALPGTYTVHAAVWSLNQSGEPVLEDLNLTVTVTESATARGVMLGVTLTAGGAYFTLAVVRGWKRTRRAERDRNAF